MKRTFFLLLLPLLLASCSLTPTNQSSPKDEEEDLVDEEEEQPEQEEETGEEGEKVDDALSLDNKVTYYFHNRHKPCYDDDWLFDWGGSKNPKGVLWENPNEAVDYSGIEFSNKKQSLTSPVFNSYKNIEVTLTLWFSSKTSPDYKATDGEPQFKIKEYSVDDKLLKTSSIEIKKSNIPNNNTCYNRLVTLTGKNTAYFELWFNNYIANGNSGYTAVLSEISLLGKN